MVNLINLIVPFVLTAFISLIAGMAMGILIASLRASKEKKQKNTPRNLKEIICFFRDKRNSQIVIEINGKFHNKADDLGIKLHTTLVQLSDELRIWLGVPDYNERIKAITPSEEEISIISSQRKPETVIGRDVLKEKKIEELDFEFQSMHSNNIKPVPVINLETTPVIQGAMSDTSKSIAAQIDEILQEKLIKSPMKDQVITLLELPDKGLVVVVDSEQYESVEEVPDAAVKNLIKDCVAEWEKKTGTG